MKLGSSWIIVCCAVCAALLYSIGCRQVNSTSQVNPTSPAPHRHAEYWLKGAETLLPDTVTRQRVVSIRAEQVTKMTFCGPHYYRWQNDPLEIRDPKIIRRFLQALSHAQAPRLGTADQADIMLIYTKSLKKGEEPLPYNFNPQHPGGCFGPEFYQVVHKYVHPASPYVTSTP